MDTEIEVVWGEPAAGGTARSGAAVDIFAVLGAVREFSKANGVDVQLFDAASIVSSDHLGSAAMHALRARKRKTMRADSLGMEMMLYASGRRQIREAMAHVGLGAGTRRIAAVIVGPGAKKMGPRLLSALDLAPLDERTAAGGRGALARLGVPVKGAMKDQLDALVLEQVALLDIEK
jgi:KEOPS complex subunit Cgi121